MVTSALGIVMEVVVTLSQEANSGESTAGDSINHEWANPNTDKYTVEIAKVTDGTNDLQNVVVIS